MNRPYIICHMVTSIDGKVTGEFLSSPDSEGAIDIYYEINRAYKADAFACGRVTMEGSFTGGWYPDLGEFEGERIPREDFVADPEAKFFAVSFDRRGRLGWKGAQIVDEDPGYGGAHIIEVLCDDAPDAYLAYLRSVGVSYIFAGETEMELCVALDKLNRLFGIGKLLLEGGSVINGAFGREDLVDELSLVVSPVTGATEDKPLFAGCAVRAYSLREVKTYDGGVVWMNYVRNKSEDNK